MNRRFTLLAAVLLVLMPCLGLEARQAGPTRPTEAQAKELASALRTLFLQALPEPLYDDTKHWGGQQPVTKGIKWRGKGLKVHPEVQKTLKNDGKWWKVRVTADRPDETLTLEVRDLRQDEPGRMTFTALVGMDTRVEYEKQNWREGIRFFSAGLRARLRVKLVLQCEVIARLESTGGFFPEAVFRLRVLGSQSGYEGLKVEHIAGVGGDAAEVFGKAFVKTMHRWRPSLERNLLAKADAAIVKAGDTKEIRIGLSGIMRKK